MQTPDHSTPSHDILLHEDNPISLRTVSVLDDGYFVTLVLPPRSMPGRRNYDIYGPSQMVELYRRRRSFLARVLRSPLGSYQKQYFKWSNPSGKLRGLRAWIGYWGLRRIHISLEKHIRVMEFTQPPELRLLWAGSGHSVALLLNGEPWAFIHEERNHGYSKGILKAYVGNPWDQELFEHTFNDGAAYSCPSG